MKSMPQFMQNYCLKIVTETIKNREINGTIRRDLMQYLIQLKNNNEGNEIDDWKINTTGKFN